MKKRRYSTANKRIATTTALAVVQQVHEAQKVRQEEHDVDHMTEQRQDQITPEQAMTSQSHPRHVAGGACWRGGRRVAVRRQEQVGQLGSERPSTRPRGGDIREQRTDAALDVLAAGDSTSTGGAQDSTTTSSTRHADRSINSSMSASRSAR